MHVLQSIFDGPDCFIHPTSVLFSLDSSQRMRMTDLRARIDDVEQ